MSGFKESNYEYKGPFTLGEIANVIGCVIDADKADVKIKDLNPLNSAGDGDLSFFDNAKYLEQFRNSQATACIVSQKYAVQTPPNTVALAVNEPYRSYAKIAQMFYQPKREQHRVNPHAAVDSTAKIGKNVSIGAFSYIGTNVEIGDNTYIGHNVTIMSATIGNDCIIHAGVRIGQDGFGFAMGHGEHIKVPQLGGVVIGNNVEIGANTCIDRGSGPDTIIGSGTKIDNLVQIGHNVTTGENCVIVSQVGIAGSTKLGDYVVLAGKVGVNGHIKIGSGATVAAYSAVAKNIEPGMTVGGIPAVNAKEWRRQLMAVAKLGKVNKNDD